MKYAIIYTSLTGNTKMLADKINEYLLSNNNELEYIGNFNDANNLESEYLFIGFWNNQGTACKEVINYLSNLNNKKIFLFATTGFYYNEAYFNKVINSVLPYINDTNKVIGRFTSIGKLKLEVRKKYERMKELHIPNVDVDFLLKEFDNSLDHPNNIDLDNLIVEVSKSIK